MKSLQVAYLSIFVTFLICGYLAGTNIQADYGNLIEKGINSASSDTSLNLMAGSKDVLIVTVSDRRGDDAKLASIWLVTYFSDNPTVIFEPIYPSISNGELVPNEVFTKAFEINTVQRRDRLSGAFLEVLSKQNIEFYEYLIIDRSYLSRVRENLKTSSEMVVSSKSDFDVSDDLHSKTLAFYNEDILTLGSICNRVGPQNPQFLQDAFRNPTSTNATYDNYLDEMINEWEASSVSSQSLICILPIKALAPIGDSEQN